MSEFMRDPAWLKTRTASELRRLLAYGKITINDARVAVGLLPIGVNGEFDQLPPNSNDEAAA